MTPESRETVSKAVVEADNLLRIRLQAAGIAVPHLSMVLVGGGDAVIAGNCRPDMIMHIAKALRNAAKRHTPPPQKKRH